MKSLYFIFSLALIGSPLSFGTNAHSDGIFETAPTSAEFVEQSSGSATTNPRTPETGPADFVTGLYSPGLFQGDIMIDEDPLALSADDGQRSAVINPNLLWPNGIVPYDISDNYTSEQRQEIESAMRDFETRMTGCIRFRQRTSDDQHAISIRNGRQQCSSYVGRRLAAGRREQFVYLDVSAGCLQRKTVQHELMHVLGFYHEQARSDRDEYIEVVLDNIIPAMTENFDKREDSDSLGLPYDFQSVMHYHRRAFPKTPNLDTIRPRPGYEGVTFGNNYGLSPNDVTKVKLLYQCSNGRHSGRTSPVPSTTTTPEPMATTNRRRVRPPTTTPELFEFITERRRVRPRTTTPDPFEPVMIPRTRSRIDDDDDNDHTSSRSGRPIYNDENDHTDQFLHRLGTPDSGSTQQCTKSTQCMNGVCQVKYKGNCEHLGRSSSSRRIYASTEDNDDTDQFLRTPDRGSTQQCTRSQECINGNCQVKYKGNCEHFGYSSSGSPMRSYGTYRSSGIPSNMQTSVPSYASTFPNFGGNSLSTMGSGVSWPQTARVVRYGYSL